MCQKCHYVSIHGHHIGLQNSCHVRDIYHVRDNTTFNVFSTLQMHDCKFPLYLKSRACQYLLLNKKSVFKVLPYKTWLLNKYCRVRDVLEWQLPYHNVCPLSFIMNTLHNQNKFFKEATYTKVHFYLKNLRGLNKPGTPNGINK